MTMSGEGTVDELMQVTCGLRWLDFCLPSGRKNKEMMKKKNSRHCSVVLCENWSVDQDRVCDRLLSTITFYINIRCGASATQSQSSI